MKFEYVPTYFSSLRFASFMPLMWEKYTQKVKVCRDWISCVDFDVRVLRGNHKISVNDFNRSVDLF